MNLKEIFSFEHLMEAHKLCRLSKQHKRGAIMFEIELGRNLAKLAEELSAKKYKFGKYRQFTIFDPKKRLIEALPYKDRVVLMCFCKNVLEPVLNNRLIYDNAASRIGKGSGFAIKRLHEFMSKLYINTRSPDFYFLKCDIAKYFQSINHRVLIEKLLKCGFSDDEMWFLRVVIESHGDIGVPLGNQTSQWFALLYLNDVDRLVKERLRARYYVRYMDDFILLSGNKAFLQHCRDEIAQYCEQELKLRLNDKTQIGKLSNGLDFLGFNHRLLPGGKIIKKMRASSRKRQQRYLKTIARFYLKNIVDDEYLEIRKNAFKAHLSGTREWERVNRWFAALKRRKKQLDTTF